MIGSGMPRSQSSPPLSMVASTKVLLDQPEEWSGSAYWTDPLTLPTLISSYQPESSESLAR